jgi:hypothetical protein
MLKLPNTNCQIDYPLLQVSPAVLLKLRLYIHKPFFILSPPFIAVQDLGIRQVLSGHWFNRIALISWLISAFSIYFLLKDIELIVHGQLYSYGLIFNAAWADPYRFYTWMIYLCLGLPMALSGVALIFSFSKESRIPEKKSVVEQKVGVPQQVPRVASQTQQPVRRVPQMVENGNGGGISCPHCHKVFSRALVMLDFRGGKHKLVSVCPYCNYVLGSTSEEKRTGVNLQVTGSASPDEKVKT